MEQKEINIAINEASEEPSHELKPKRARKKKWPLAKIITFYLLGSNIIFIAIFHIYFKAMFLKFIKGQDVVVVNGKIMDRADAERPNEKYYFKVNGRIYENPDEAMREKTKIIGQQMQRRAEQNQRRAEQLERSNTQNQTIQCWMDSNGNRKYTNIPPPDGRPCP